MKLIEIMDIPIYNTNICFMIGGTVDNFKILYEGNKSKFNERDYKEIIDDIENDKFAAFTRSIQCNSYFIFIREEYIKEPKIFIHEIYHVTNFILWDRSVEECRSNEPHTYLIAYIVEKYCDMIKRNEQLEFEEAEKSIKTGDPVYECHKQCNEIYNEIIDNENKNN